jgi:putative transposase
VVSRHVSGELPAGLSPRAVRSGAPPPEKLDQPKLEQFATLQPANEEGDMKKSKCSEEQIAVALRQKDAGAPIPQVTHRCGISEATYYVWCKRDGQMAVAAIRRLRQLEDENRKLKQLVADLTLDKVMLQEVLAKKL